MEKYIEILAKSLKNKLGEEHDKVKSILEEEIVYCNRIISDYEELEKEKWVDRSKLIAHEKEIISRIKSIFEDDSKKRT